MKAASIAELKKAQELQDWSSELRELFDQPGIADSFHIRVGGRSLFGPNKAEPVSGSKLLRFESYLEPGSGDTKTLDIEKSKLDDKDSLGSRSPQAKVADLVFDLLKSDPRPGDAVAESISLVLEQETMNPILRFDLVRSLLTLAKRISGTLGPVSADYLPGMKEANVSPLLANWVEPDEKMQNTYRPFSTRADAFLRKNAKGLISDLRAALSRTNKQPQEPVWVGWLRRDGAEWTIELSPLRVGEATNGDLLAVDPLKTRFMKVGFYSNGSATFNRTNEAQQVAVQGRPVFLVPASPGNSDD